MCPFEVLLALEARGLEHDTQLEMAALHACWLLQPHLRKGRRIRPRDLLGKGSTSMLQFASIAEAVAFAKQQAQERDGG